MTGDLDLRGNKLINPGEIEMNRKLITNLNTDEDNDLSAVNMITLKKFHPDVPEPTHEVTKDIDLKELFNVVKSKQRSLNELKTHYDSLVSYEEVNENFLSRREEFPMETQLDMNHNSITNLKDPQFGGEAATKDYADKKLALTGGKNDRFYQHGDIDMKELFNVVKSKQRSLNELKTHYDSLVSYEEVNENFLSRREEFPMETQLDMNHNSITNLKDPQFGGEAATKDYADKKTCFDWRKNDRFYQHGK